MNVIQKSEAIKNSLRKGFQDGSAKMAKRKCYGYEVGPDGELTVNPDEAQVVRWIFDQYLAGHSLGKIATGLERQDILFPTGEPKWNREAIDKLLSNKNILGGHYSRRQSALAQSKLKMMASWSRISIPGPMRPSFLMRYSWQCSGKK